MKKIILIFVFIAISCKREYQKTSVVMSREKHPVVIQPLNENSLQSVIQTSGVLHFENEHTLAFKNGGILNYFDIEEGQVLKPGSLIARLDMGDFRAQERNALASYEKYLADYDRIKNLFSEDAATMEQLENAETALRKSESQLEHIGFNIRHSSLYSPAGCMVLRKMANVGEYVGPGEPVVLLGEVGGHGNQIVKAGLADREVVNVNTGDSVSVTFSAMPHKSYPGHVKTISGTADPGTGMFTVEVSLTDYFDSKLKNGFTGDILIYPDEPEKLIKIPMSALVSIDQGKAGIFVTADKHTVYRQNLPVHDIFPDYFTVVPDSVSLDSLWVITEGAAWLKELDSITIQDPLL
ncbi:efflux RND transporter periplasmic adaptor subunit [Zunongwangia sp. F363]|uniref:Efflux RND transporter periplasmic adaptor subunit n=1 Tax=Autumnicola tepida TaxID=3075595 RepID=A0ABU3CEQ5_9FLAO|nr:efflux RND transporter periplasmic adaptor subunit [Zunongwangia sp. F363]MDT0644825.1 efflux RND transporter periplasmic adaptor subunit [Zunongwangia sp. F363]